MDLVTVIENIRSLSLYTSILGKLERGIHGKALYLCSMHDLYPNVSLLRNR